MLLHLIQDNIFTDTVIELFETVAPNQNIYLLSDTKIVNNIKNIGRIKSAPYGTEAFWSFFDKSTVKAVIIHGMTHQASMAIHKFSRDIHFHWMCMGYDLYGTYAELNSSLFQPETEHAIQEYNKYRLSGFRKSVKEVIFKITGSALDKGTLIKSAMNKIKTCSMVINEDFDLFKAVSGTKAEHYSFNYGYLEKLVPMNLEPHNNGQHILLGNSSAWTNNHLDAFQLLRNLCSKEKGVKVYTPLSYGDESCKKFVIKKGKEILGDCFVPITEFLPINAYTEILKKCSIAIMNHNRQQAMGNIIILVWLGMRLYLKESNPISHFLKRIGVTFFEINDGQYLANAQALQPLSEPEIIENRKALRNHYGKKLVLQRTNYLCEYLLNVSPNRTI